MVFEDVGKLSKIIEAIHAAGFRCAMDDFGSGYSSLNLIQNIPPPARSFEYAFHQQVQHRHAQQYTRDGKLYCLPCSAQVRDIVYNTILFEEKGWKVPYDFNRFIALCRTIEARGIRSIHLGFGNSELLDTAFGATATEAASAPRPMPNGWPTTKGAGAASGSISALPSIRFKPCSTPASGKKAI